MARINTNIPSLIAQSNLARSNQELGLRLERRSTGVRINRGKDDPAGLIISQRIATDISGVEQAAALPDVCVFHAGTKREGRTLVTNGGRVLCVTGLGADLRAARDVAYDAIQLIDFEDMHYRKDIGWRELESSQEEVAGAR